MTVEIPDSLVDALRAATRVAVLTGAGVSAESGVPTFREAQTGLWARFDPMELATPEAFERNPRLVWEWYEMRRALCARAAPNRGHTALAELQTMVEDFTLTTQNVDGLHERAGSTGVLELHGNIMRSKCFESGRLWDGPLPVAEVPPPLHPVTGGMLRPDVVWFGEMLPEDALNRSFEAALRAEIYLVIGTSALVHPAASLPVAARRAGAMVVEVNPTVTPLSPSAAYCLRGAAGAVLGELMARVSGATGGR